MENEYFDYLISRKFSEIINYGEIYENCLLSLEGGEPRVKECFTHHITQRDISRSLNINNTAPPNYFFVGRGLECDAELDWGIYKKFPECHIFRPSLGGSSFANGFDGVSPFFDYFVKNTEDNQRIFLGIVNAYKEKKNKEKNTNPCCEVVAPSGESSGYMLGAREYTTVESEIFSKFNLAKKEGKLLKFSSSTKKFPTTQTKHIRIYRRSDNNIIFIQFIGESESILYRIYVEDYRFFRTSVYDQVTKTGFKINGYTGELNKDKTYWTFGCAKICADTIKNTNTLLKRDAKTSGAGFATLKSCKIGGGEFTVGQLSKMYELQSE